MKLTDDNILQANINRTKQYVRDYGGKVSTLPTATSSNVGQIYQYTGATTLTYTHGYFYECKENNGTYSWENVPVGEGSGDVSDSTTTITTSTATYPEYSAGETLKVIFGKIKKFLSDLYNKKADKVTSATNGNFAGLDANGNLTDSGKSASDFITSHQTIKQDGITGATVNRFGECTTQASVNDKYVSITEGTYSLEAGAKVTVKFRYTNTATSPRLKVGNTLAQDIYYRGVRVGSSAPAGVLNGVIDFVYDGTNYNIVGTFVNTTYESKAAVSGGTALSLVTTGEKYIWNNPPSSGHTILNGSGTAMNQRSKLQFVGGNVKDDSTNDKTVVTIARELTRAEYDALSTAEKNNGTTYYIPDAPSSYTGVPQSMIGDVWVVSHAYAVGDYCIDGNVLYKCKTAHTSTASNRPPYASYWDAVSVASQLPKQWVELGTIYGTNDGAPSGKNKSINIPSNAKRIAYLVGTGWYEFPLNTNSLKFAVYRPYASSVVKPRYLYFTTQTTGTIYNIYDENGTNIGTSDEAKNLVTKVYVQY